MSIFDIKRLSCVYKDKETNLPVHVLDIENIVINRGEITVILGPSGSGKSTFMEAISLMAKTIGSKTNPQPKNGEDIEKRKYISDGVLFYPSSRNSPIDLVDIKDEKGNLRNLRYENFSFIFQDTNIMANFNPIENVALPKMVNPNIMDDGQIVKNEAKEILTEQLNLHISLENSANEYSGGQKQRFAFARAFMAKGKVLFGDEPTGNLDDYNSEKLFWVIKKHISSNEDELNETSINKIGAIVVTHNIDLALQFADQIIVIVKPDKSEDVEDDEKPDLVKGYTNPFLVYRNLGSTRWRNTVENVKDINPNQPKLLPPINDDDSNRFNYVIDWDKEGKEFFIKDKFKKEITFFLNNSYAEAQKILVEAAKNLNKKLKNINEINEEEHELYSRFEELRTYIISYIEEATLNRLVQKKFDSIILAVVRRHFRDRKDILELFSNLK